MEYYRTNADEIRKIVDGFNIENANYQFSRTAYGMLANVFEGLDVDISKTKVDASKALKVPLRREAVEPQKGFLRKDAPKASEPETVISLGGPADECNFSLSEKRADGYVYDLDIWPEGFVRDPDGTSYLEVSFSVCRYQPGHAPEAKYHKNWPFNNRLRIGGIKKIEDIAFIYNRIAKMGIDKFLACSPQQLMDDFGFVDLPNLNNKMSDMERQDLARSEENELDAKQAENPMTVGLVAENEGIKYPRESIRAEQINELNELKAYLEEAKMADNYKSNEELNRKGR